jgi:hypothetical protein
MARQINWSKIGRLAKTLSPGLAIAISLLGVGLAFDANRLSRTSINNQFETRFNAVCHFDYDSERVDFLVKSNAGAHSVEVPIECSISNLSGKTITINSISPRLQQQVSSNTRKDIEAYIKVSNLVNSNDKSEIQLSGFGKTNITVPPGQQQNITVYIDIPIRSKNVDLFICPSPIPAAGSARCAIEADPKVWEKLIESSPNTLSEKDDVRLVFVFESIDAKQQSTDVCLPYEMCFLR